MLSTRPGWLVSRPVWPQICQALLRHRKFAPHHPQLVINHHHE
ncbi:MAG: hypothetical protein WKG07_19425 [Hymenobacter sp.]